MLAFLLVTAALATIDDRAEVAALIGRLGAEAFDDRVAAYKALKRLGDAALPALRAAANDAGGPRVQARALALIEDIGRQSEATRFERPTPVRLDFRDRPLAEVLDALNARHHLGLSLKLAPPRRWHFPGPDEAERMKALRERPITLEATEPLPFWEALDRLCQAAEVRYSVNASGAGTDRGGPTLYADHIGRGPVIDSGPFRVQILGLNARFGRDFTVDPDTDAGKPPGAGQLAVSLVVLSEPDLMIAPRGPIVVDEATDDLGRSLVAPAPAAEPNMASRHARGPIRTSVTLVAPVPSAATIRRLRGRVPAIAVARAAEPMIVALKGPGPIGKSITVRGSTILVDELKVDPQGRPTVQMSVRGSRDLATPAQRSGDPFGVDRVRPVDHLRLRDASGRILRCTTEGGGGVSDGQGPFEIYRLIVSADPEDGPAAVPNAPKAPLPMPAELCYYDFVRAELEIPFDFRDVPMP